MIGETIPFDTIENAKKKRAQFISSGWFPNYLLDVLFQTKGCFFSYTKILFTWGLKEDAGSDLNSKMLKMNSSGDWRLCGG